MQIFYLKNIKSDFLEGQEYNHCYNVLRKKVRDKIKLTDGKGNLYSAEIQEIKNRKIHLNKLKIIKSIKKNKNTFVAVAPPKSFNRVEWMVEKLTEIGVSKIFFIETSNSERNKIRIERLEKKIISAMKQCNSLFKTEIEGIIKIKEFVKKYKFKNKYVADIKSKSDFEENKINENSVMLIGPEGDLTNDELLMLKKDGYNSISLGNMILRTETAAVVGGFLMNITGEKK